MRVRICGVRVCARPLLRNDSDDLTAYAGWHRYSAALKLSLLKDFVKSLETTHLVLLFQNLHAGQSFEHGRSRLAS